MTIFSFGSINVDHFYRVPHIPAPGETLAALGHEFGLGGKGANQSVAAAMAGRDVKHIGMVGRDGAEMLERLRGLKVDVSAVGTADVATGHANIHVDDRGENMIVIFAGANEKQSLNHLETALSMGVAADTLILQNEVTMVREAAEIARAKGMRVIYSAAPFVAEAAQEMLPVCDLLVLNEVESQQLSEALGVSIEAVPVPQILITKGAEGASWRDQASGVVIEVAAFKVTPVDTTGAGDCFIGYVAAALDEGMAPEAAMRLGAAASAIQVTRPGTAEAIPTRAEVDAFLAENRV